jgi:hypothetical protein
MVLSSLDGNLRADLDDLSLLLSDDDWQGADRLTADLMLRAIAHTPDAAPSRGRQPWLSAEALATFPCQLLHAIDDRWLLASGGQFGFSAQFKVYREILAAEDFDPSLYNWGNPHPFFEEVGWLMLFPLRPIGFLKFYPQLAFDLEAPMGHLPALWYWQVPRLTSLVMGGFFTGQGGGFGDLARLDAMVLRLTRCHQLGG